MKALLLMLIACPALASGYSGKLDYSFDPAPFMARSLVDLGHGYETVAGVQKKWWSLTNQGAEDLEVGTFASWSLAGERRGKFVGGLHLSTPGTGLDTLLQKIPGLPPSAVAGSKYLAWLKAGLNVGWLDTWKPGFFGVNVAVVW